MNKKLTNVLRTNVTLYFICLVLFALAAIPFDVRLAIGEGAAAVLLLIIARRRSRSAAAPRRKAVPIRFDTSRFLLSVESGLTPPCRSPVSCRDRAAGRYTAATQGRSRSRWRATGWT